MRRQRTGDELYALSDSELGGNDADDNFEETTVFSDSLYGDSLPSMRAQLAATQMQNRRKRDFERSGSEKRTLVSSHESGEGTSTTVLENSLKKETEISSRGHYSSLGGNIVPKKRRKKDLAKT